MTKEELNFMRNVKFLRKQSKLSQKQLGDALGKAETSIGSWETGYRSPTVADTLVVCRYFNVSIQQMLDTDIQAERDLSGAKIYEFVRENEMTEDEENELVKYAKYVISQREN